MTTSCTRLRNGRGSLSYRVFTICAALVAPAGALPPPAQIRAPEKATLVQLSLSNPDAAGAEARRRALADEAATITSCRQAFDAVERFKARGLKGTLTVRTNVALADLPSPLRTALAARPVGRPTPIYGGVDAFRVLIRCEPTFRVPVGPGGVRPVPPPATGAPTI